MSSIGKTKLFKLLVSKPQLAVDLKLGELKNPSIDRESLFSIAFSVLSLLYVKEKELSNFNHCHLHLFLHKSIHCKSSLFLINGKAEKELIQRGMVGS